MISLVRILDLSPSGGCTFEVTVLARSVWQSASPHHSQFCASFFSIVLGERVLSPPWKSGLIHVSLFLHPLCVRRKCTTLVAAKKKVTPYCVLGNKNFFTNQTWATTTL